MKTKKLLLTIAVVSFFFSFNTGKAQVGTIVDSFTYNIGVPFGFGIAYDGSGLWISGASNGYIYKLSTTGVILDSLADPAAIFAPESSLGIVCANNHLFTTCYSCDTLYEIDLATKQVINDYTGMSMDERVSIGYDGVNKLFFANGADGSGAYTFDIGSGTFNSWAESNVARGLVYADNHLYGTDGGIWPNFTPRIFDIDTASGTVSNYQTWCVDDAFGGVGMAYDGQYIWQVKYGTSLVYKIQLNSPQTSCNDTVYSVPQSALYYCFGGTCANPGDRPSMEISGSYGAAATSDSTIVWLCTWDNDGPGPLSSYPDSLATGHDLRNSTNRAPLFPGQIPTYLTTMPQVTPFALQYPLTSAWQDSGKAMCFTPVQFDSGFATHHTWEIDSCFGFGEPIQKTYVRSIHTDHFFSCDAGINKLHLTTWGGLPGFNHYWGYGNFSQYTVNINGTNYNTHWGDTLVVDALDLNLITISDSLSGAGIADGCTIYDDTLVLYPALVVSGLASSYYDNSPDDPFTVSPAPSGAMRIDFFTSEAVAAGLYVISAQGDTLYSRYPLGDDFGVGAVVDVLTSLYIYDLPLDGNPYSVVATGDDGLGWQYATCYGLNYDGYFQVYDMSTGDSLSTLLYPIGDGQCGAVGVYADTFGVYNVQQYNKTELSINGNPLSVIGPDSVGNATFSPSTAGTGTYDITFTYNDNRLGLCDKDTIITVVVNSSIGINEISGASAIVVNNPVSDKLMIIPGKEKIDFIELTDAFGRIVLRGPYSIGAIVDVSSLPAGVYLLQVYNENKRLATRKIVKTAN